MPSDQGRAGDDVMRSALYAAWNEARAKDDMLGMEPHDGIEFTLWWLRELPVEQRMAAMGMTPALSIPPLDCNEECMDGPCTCSGKFRVRAWGEPNDPIRPVAEGVRPHRG